MVCNPKPFHEPNVTTLTDMGRHEHRRKILSPAYNDFDVMESLRYSAENHLGKVLDDHIDRADQGVAEVDLAQIAERFSIQAFSNMAFGQVRRHRSDAERRRLTNPPEPGRIRCSSYQSHCL